MILFESNIDELKSIYKEITGSMFDSEKQFIKTCKDEWETNNLIVLEDNEWSSIKKDYYSEVNNTNMEGGGYKSLDEINKNKLNKSNANKQLLNSLRSSSNLSTNTYSHQTEK